jgi:hypothetical protein
LVNRQIDAIRGTIIRQTMFAEFEKLIHASAESGEPLTIDRLTEIYRGLLKLYFGPDFALDDELKLECFRIPHFYRAFYVYKYATGMSAAMALSDRVLAGKETPLAPAGRGAGGEGRSRDGGGQQTPLAAYLRFLSGGCSRDPLDLLRDAGVDMEHRRRPGPVRPVGRRVRPAVVGRKQSSPSWQTKSSSSASDIVATCIGRRKGASLGQFCQLPTGRRPSRSLSPGQRPGERGRNDFRVGPTGQPFLGGEWLARWAGSVRPRLCTLGVAQG